MSRTLPFTLKSLALCCLVTPAAAQTFLAGDHSIGGSVCLGDECTASENFGSLAVLIKSDTPGLQFRDTSSGGGFPTTDWGILTNDVFSGGLSYFAIENRDTDLQVFRIDGDAPENALYVSDNGSVGLGTSLPQSELHVTGSFEPSVRLEYTGSVGPRIWELVGNSLLMGFRDDTRASLPFWMRRDAESDTLVVYDRKRVGVGIADPQVQLHVFSAVGDAAIHVQNSGFAGNPSEVREMFKMQNNGGSYFTLENTESDTQWFFVHEDAAPNRFIITDGVNDGPEMTLTADGILTVEGGFVAGSTTLNVPDYVFDDDYALRPLAEVASFIQENSHLPEVPSADQIAEDGLNMTQMQMTLLKKVEELTLYTLAQERVIAEQSGMIAALTARVDAIE